MSFLLWISFFLTHLEGQSHKTFREERRQIEEDVTFEIGPFKLFPTILLSNVGYDSNVYHMSQYADPISDFTATFALRLRAYLLYRDWVILSFTEIPEYVFYLEQKNIQGWNNTFSTEAKFCVLHRFVLSGNYLNGNRRYRPSSEFDVPLYEKIIGYGGTFFYETARRTSFGLGTDVSKIRYEDVTQPDEQIPVSTSLNRQEKNLSLNFFYRVRPESNFFISGGYSEYKFEYVESQWRDSISYQVYTGIQFPLLGRLRGTLSVGYKKLIPQLKELYGYSGIVGNTNFDIRLGRFVFRVLYIRDIPFSYSSENLYFIQSTYGGGISFYLTQYFRIDYNINYGSGEYTDEILYPVPDGEDEMIKRRDEDINHSAGFVIRIMENTGVGLNVNFWDRTSNLPNYNRERVFFGLFITYDF